MKTKSKAYTIYLRGEIMVSLNIDAISLEEAVEKAKGLQVTADVLQEGVSYDDGELEVIGVLGVMA